MKSLIPLTLTLLSTATALPADNPLRILPQMWKYEIISLRGPGCPAIDPSETYQNRPTFGQNTVDGSEIYYWFFAFPYLRASVGGDVAKASTWCETTLKYTELNSNQGLEESADFRLRLHKNGTGMVAKYDLEPGTEARWGFTYFPPGEEEVVDEIVVKGPFSSGKYTAEHRSPVAADTERWALEKCGGDQTFKFRTELTVTATKEGAKGFVGSEDYNGKFYGAQPGISYDWEYCEK